MEFWHHDICKLQRHSNILTFVASQGGKVRPASLIFSQFDLFIQTNKLSDRNTNYRVSHNTVSTLFLSFSRVLEPVQRNFWPLFSSPWNLLHTVGVNKNCTLVFVNFSAQDASILKKLWLQCSKFPGQLNKGQKFLCTGSRTRENDKNKVETVLWDTRY